MNKVSRLFDWKYSIDYMVNKKLLLGFFALFFIIVACEKDDGSDPDNGGNNNGGNGGTTKHEANKKGTGESANALLANKDFSKMKVEIQYVEDYKPTDRALDSFKNFLEKYLHKPQGFEFKKTRIGEPGGDDDYSVQEVIDIEDANRNVYNEGNTIGVYFLFINGEHEDDTDNSKTLGVAYRNTSMVIYEETIQELSGGLNEPATHKLENAVINHEMGHNLGLVNNGSSMQTDHQDEQHGKHCDEDNCLMHWTVKTGDVVEKLLGGSVPELDVNCRDDLKANGGK